MLEKDEIKDLVQEFFYDYENSERFDKMYRVTTLEGTSWRQIRHDCLTGKYTENKINAWTRRKVKPYEYSRDFRYLCD